MKKTLKLIILLIAILFTFPSNAQSNESETIKYEANWKSLQQYKVPEWWKNMKFGIYFHFGPYSVPAHKTEWYSHWMYVDGNPIRKYHEQTYGPLWEFGYKDFIPMFKAEKFNANEWVSLFKQAGAQFVGPCVEHADGFAMWDSKLTKWDAMDMGPHRDIVGEMEKAVKAQNLKFLVTFHRQWLYAWYPTWNKNTDCGNPKYAGLYGPKAPKNAFEMAKGTPVYVPDDKFNQDWLNRLEELMDNYNPDLIWFDNRMNLIGEEYRKKFLADFYNKGQERGKQVVCTYKFHDLAEGSAVLDLERSRMNEKKQFPWLTDDSIDWNAWCNVSNPDYKTTNRMIDFIVDVVSKNGAVLLNVTPTAEGVIPEGVKERLLAIGKWFKINGKAIYGSRPWKIYGEGPQKIVEGHLSERQNGESCAQDIRFTTKDGNLYAFALDWPKNNTVIIKSLAKSKGLISKIKSVKMLGYSGSIKWKLTEEGLIINFPNKEKVCSFDAYAFELKVK